MTPALTQAAAEDMPTLTDLGYEGLAGPALRMPVKKPKGREDTDRDKQYNLIVRGVHGIAERANSLLKTTFKALRRVSVCPWRSARSPRPPWSCSIWNTAVPFPDVAPPDPRLLPLIWARRPGRRQAAGLRWRATSANRSPSCGSSGSPSTADNPAAHPWQNKAHPSWTARPRRSA